MSRLYFAHTKDDMYPGYINISDDEDDETMVVVTVRADPTKKNDESVMGNVAVIKLHKTVWAAIQSAPITQEPNK